MCEADIDLFVAYLWSIWNHRNNIVHNMKVFEPLDIIRFTQRLLADFKGGWMRSTVREESEAAVSWSPPPVGFIKVNVDASISQALGMVACGMVARDAEGAYLAWRHARMKSIWSPEVAEARAVIEGIRLAAAFGWRKEILESDCINVIHAFNSSELCLSDAGTFVEEGGTLMGGFETIRLVHVRRTANEAAHKFATEILSSCEGVGSPPVSF